MSEFEKLARNACQGRKDCPEELTLTQPNWIKFMLGIPHKEKPKEETKVMDKSIIEKFLKLWLKANMKLVMDKIHKTLEAIGERKNLEYYNKDVFFEKYIVNYSLIDCNIRVLLAYRGKSDGEWASYFLKRISTMIKEELGGVVRGYYPVKKSTFIYRVAPNEEVVIFSKTADVSCIRDASLQLRAGKNIVADKLSPKPGLKIKCKKEFFDAKETLDISMVIKNFRTGNEKIAYAPEYLNEQFLATELFKDCKNLLKVKLSDKVNFVESDCFVGCSRMKKLEVSQRCHIEESTDYSFDVVRRQSPIQESTEGIPEDPNDPSPSDAETMINDSFNEDGTRIIGVDGDEDEKESEGALPLDINDTIVKDSQASINDDVKWCLELMPNQLHAEILRLTYYGLPKEDIVPEDEIIKPDKNGNVKIGDVGRYLERKRVRPGINEEDVNHNWYAAKHRAMHELRIIYHVYTTWVDWKLKKQKGKINEANIYLLQRNISADEINVLGLLLSGKTYADIAKMVYPNQINIRRGIFNAFEVLYKFMNN